ncbi:MAG: dihydroorotase, partial [Bacteroidota bacterium]|nr:dihydroorotase [Bacteroidota bacterium]MDX5429491.1 dihydroorotase [Bacteroidota bacterium]MDX5468276.1 dihydroorotase [Bacteroidota bacterium]
MTQILIKQVRIIDPQSPFHQQVCDLLVSNGTIESIANSISSNASQVIDASGYCLSPGWVDMRANFQDPGFEYKEDLRSGASAAQAGGFTAVGVLPETLPILQSKSEIEYVKNLSQSLPVRALPLGALSKDLKGEEITEMFDMHQSGAVAFSNANHSVKAGVMQRALLYVKGFDGLICSHPNDAGIASGGQMHEGYHSTMLGLKGIPEHAETMAIERDLELLRYTGGRLHISHISTALGVEKIRAAKKEGLEVSCDVAAHQLLFTDAVLEEYDTRYKVFPPFRSEVHRKALIEGLLDGTIDAVISDHQPEDTEHKEVEFDFAAFGISSIQVVLPTLLKAMPELTPEKLVEVLSI